MSVSISISRVNSSFPAHRRPSDAGRGIHQGRAAAGRGIPEGRDDADADRSFLEFVYRAVSDLCAEQAQVGSMYVYIHTSIFKPLHICIYIIHIYIYHINNTYIYICIYII